MPNLSILIATYNRADVLQETLDAMCAVDREGLDVEFIVIDNNSTDNTAEVIDSYKESLPVRRLFQPCQGKSAALNLALDTVELGEIVVFTDDDVVPKRDWLRQIKTATETWPETNVFGGRIEVKAPDGVHVPSWLQEDACLVAVILGQHDERSVGPDCPIYQEGRTPFGAHFWVRKAVLRRGSRFSLRLGSGAHQPTSEDSLFLWELQKAGNPIRYVSAAVVGHRIRRTETTVLGVLKRVFRWGRGKPWVNGILGPELLQRHPRLWLLRRLLSVVRYFLFALVQLLLTIYDPERLQNAICAIMLAGYNYESIAVSRCRALNTVYDLQGHSYW